MGDAADNFVFDLKPGILPARDGSLDNMINIHESTYLLTQTLTGGAKASMCLLNKDAAAMGEGWSDFVAIIMTREVYTRHTFIKRGMVSNEDFLI